MTFSGLACFLAPVGAACVVLLLATGARAEKPDEQPRRETPREAVVGFRDAASVGDWDRAAHYLDQSRVPPARRTTDGPVLARKLAVVLDRAVVLDPEALSDEPAGRRDDGLPANLEQLATVEARRGAIEIRLHRRPGAEGLTGWRFAPGTVARIPALYAEFGDGWLADLLPPVLLEVRVLTLALWQWIALLVMVVVGYAASWAVVMIAVLALQPVVERSRTTLDEQFLAATVGPFKFGIALVLFSAGVLALGLPSAARELLGGLGKAAAIVTITWFLVRAADIFARLVTERLAAGGKSAAAAMVPVGGKAAKAAILGLALLAVLQNVGINVTGILAGLGIGGLAVALAAQKSLENVFGGLTLILDQPVRVGDFCRFGDRIGTVEEVGLRSTRIRTLDRTVVSVPNSEFVSLHLENFTRRDRIWLTATLGLRYETTPDQLRHALVEMRRLLYAHPRVDPDTARVRFVGFGAYSLDCEIFAYVLTADYGEFLAIREDIFLRVMDVVAASGSSFAFPSQTLYVGQDPGLDKAKSRAAEEQVRAWRMQSTMPLPEFSAEQITALRATLDYPPNGAAVQQRG